MVRVLLRWSMVVVGAWGIGVLAVQVAAQTPPQTPPQMPAPGLSSLSRKGAALAFHRRHLVFDWHVDSLHHLTRWWYDFTRWQRRRDLDIPKLRGGGMGAQVFAMWVPPRLLRRPGAAWAHLQRMVRTYQRLLVRSRGWMEHARTMADVRRIRSKGKIAALLAIEGAHPLEGRLERVKTLVQWGIVYVGLTWNNSNSFAISAQDEWWSRRYRRRGLSAKGRRLVRLLEDHRILIDVSHAGRQTFWDVVHMARRPFIASHSDAYTLQPHYRNLTDRQLRAVAQRGGVVGVNFYTRFLRRGRDHRRRTTVWDVVRHIKHIVKVAGIDAVGLGSDYDGMITAPRGLKHVGQLPNLTRALSRAGFTDSQIQKILGGNSVRVLQGLR